MKTRFLIILLIVNCSIPIVNSQVSQEWVARYHFYSDDQEPTLAIDNSANVYVTGRSMGPGTGFDYATVKYNSSGTQLWVARYNGPGNNLDAPTSITVDNSGNVYVTGFSRSGTSADYNDFATIKYNSDGFEQWVRRYDFGGSDIPCKVAIDGNGDILVGGWGTQPGTGPDFAVVKYAPNGNVIWVRTYDSGGNDNQYDYAVAMAVDSFNSVYLTGSLGGNISSAPDWGTVKWNSQGIFQWVQRYNGPGSGVDYAKAIAVTDSGYVYVTGVVWGNNNGDYATIKYNSAGAQQWVVFYNGGFGDGATSIITDDSGNAYVTGYISVGSNADYLTIKYNSAGIQQWTARFNGPANSYDIPCCIKLDDSGNVYVTGYATVAANNTDYCTIKYNNSGVQKWVMYYGAFHPNNLYDQSSALGIDNQNNVYVTGSSIGDIATVKYSQITGIKHVSGELPKEFKLFQNYPNPFNPVTRFKFQVAGLSNIRIVIYDVLGRVIETLVNEKLKPGTYEAAFDASNYPSGVYYYKLTAGSYSDTKKMILIK